MDRHRGDRFGNPDSNRNSRMHSRSFDNPPFNSHHRNPNNPRSGFSDGSNPFNSSQNFALSEPGFRPMSGGAQMMPMAGQKRSSGGFSDSGRGFSPDKTDGSNFAKLFIGSVPRTATEEDIRPLFEEHGDVIEVALIKDKRTGQQQGCCFIKYATSEEADGAIRALHNQYTLPGGSGPIQVRYADGERERLVEFKLFVGSLNKQATEKEVEEIFSPYGHVEDVYLMRDELKHSRGCGFVKFSHRDMAAAAINGLNGTYMMRGCDQPLTVRFADPKRPRAGESRFGAAFGGPGFGPRSQAPPGIRPTPIPGDSAGGRIPPNAWHPISPRNVGPSSQVNIPALESQFPPRGGLGAVSSTAAGSLGILGGPSNGSLQGMAATPSPTSQQSFNPFTSMGHKISPLQKPFQSPQHLPSSLQLHQHQTPASLSQTPTSQPSIQQLGQLQIPLSVSQNSFSQALPSQQLFGLGGPLSVSQSMLQNGSPGAAQQNPSNLQGLGATANQQQFPTSSIQQQMLLPNQQLPSQLPQVLPQHQTPALQPSFQSSQHAFSQLQHQLNLMQPSTQSLSQQPNSQTTKPQSQWNIPQIDVSTSATAPTSVGPATISSAPVVPISTPAAAPLTCNWTEHTSPEGYKYYYNSVTSESKWEKPDELTLFEQQKLSQKQLVPQLQTQSHTHIQSAQQLAQMQQVQLQTQLRQQQMQFQQPSLSLKASSVTGQHNIQELGYAQLQATNISGIDPARVQQGIQAAQEWIWKNKPAGT
ncbi:flowering time control protein FCA-like isoform X2 [Tasmannia lanceolata]|uniref:flowering time control protein FCA-like isoform X2 n=1 Tax=Tasmannia lanceolata TaxID=3420 RepID=UPI0040643050